MRLQGDVAGQALALGDLERLGQPRRRVVGGGDLADLARLDQLAEGAERLRQRRVGVVEVGVVEVDRLDPEPAQRVLGGGLWIVSARRLSSPASLPTLVAMTNSSRVAARRQPLADDRLRLAAFVARGARHVDVGGVDEVAAAGDVGVEHGEGLFAVGGPAEDVAAEAEAGDVEVGAWDHGHAARL